MVERVPINDLKKILEALSNLSDKKLTPDELSEAVRPAISSLLIQKISSVKEPLNVVTFNPDFEQMLISMSKKSGSEGLLIDPSLAKQMIKSIMEVGEKLSVESKKSYWIHEEGSWENRDEKNPAKGKTYADKTSECH